MKPTLFFILVTVLLSPALSLSAVDLGQLKRDMKERLPAIEALWQAGKIGENNQGFLSPRASLGPAEAKLVEAENADRRIVYRAIASSTQTTPEKVGAQRAAQISERAAKGLWLHDAQGRWYQK